MRAILLIILFLNIIFSSVAQDKVSFYTSDSLKITADLYLKDYKMPFIILCHQAGASRGEYSEIAPKLLKLDFNCLAIDLRNGEKMNYVFNETADRARQEKKIITILDSKKDIEAAIRYIKKISPKKIILFGSSYSASLCLLIAKNHPDIKAVIAFSPGEYFRPGMIVKNEIAGLNMPIFIASSDLEYEYIVQMLSGVSDEWKTIYHPTNSKGIHGAKALWNSSDSSNEVWFELMLFIKKLREPY